LQQNLINEVSYPNNPSPVVMVRKADAQFGYRFCIDYSVRNRGVKVTSHPMPNVQDIINDLAGKRYMIKLDFRTAYWQIEVQPSSRKYTTFNVGQRCYEWTRLPMGHVLAQSHLQRCFVKLMETIPEMSVYVDDLVGGVNTFTELSDLKKRQGDMDFL
jgi:hypothetical protein